MQDMRVEKLIRIGKRSSNNRPLLVKLGSEEEKKWALSNAKKLRNSKKFERVYLARDMTEEERRKDKQLREELRSKRQREGEASFIIRRGKVVKMDRKEQERRVLGADRTQSGADSRNQEQRNVTEGRSRENTDQRQNLMGSGNF